ncbi:unnamed protein product [Ranitomeya imitator]|uniref:Gypsy retrotransposon integrase-like protein 1 n=1 Tax=Ranitomeya imitator TaxID=111125 RepID=A0ABN9MB75_9NEOB|nr:unnamed protein product [Ranitomeya imitator]
MVELCVDSGAEGNFMSSAFAQRHAIPLVMLAKPVTVRVVNGSTLPSQITHQTIPITLSVSPSHQEIISLLVIPEGIDEVLLGIPWLRYHSPHIEWSSGRILGWSKSCEGRCQRECIQVATTQVPADISSLPKHYWPYADVFSKRAAETLPPHRPYDCPIDLLPGAEPPRGRVYPLSLPETEAMSQYIQENLARGFIRKSVSPAGAGFFFVEKKTGDLRPCIDYRALNAITVKNKYPLPLISELIDRLRGARVFTKLDLRGAYNLIRIREGDEWKTAFNTRDGHYEYLVMPFGLCNAPAVFEDFVNNIFRDMLTTSVVVYLDDILIFSPDINSHWRDVRKVFDLLRANSLYAKLEKCVFEQESLPFLGYIISAQGLAMDPAKLQAVMDWQEPHSLKAVQRFMGFINYYRQFIPHFSTLVAPLVALTKKGANPKLWSEEVSKAFLSIKSHFASAPILHRPDVDKPFILEVDASSVGAGAVLFQKDAQGQKHPCFFFSKTFTPAERNYSIGDRELLAMKLAFSEWRHLLEGARFPFQVFTDHKNLVYLQTAQRLNSRQARWSLFFSRFHFTTLHFLSGEKNVRADALSRSVVSSEEEEEPRLIVPSESLRTVAPVSLESVPPDKTFVPANLRPEVLSWAHSSRVGGHFGTKRTSELLARTYWWPHMARDVRDYI